jgi:hypothetical protein
MHGTSDNNLVDNDSAATVAQLIALNNTIGVPVQIVNYLDDPANVTDTTHHEYSKIPGSQGRALTYYEIHNGDHSVSSLNAKPPNGCKAGTTPGVDCAHNRDYNAVDEVWAFWNAAAGLNLP